MVQHDDNRFLSARDGDHLMVMFQCDLCHFRNIQQRDPNRRNASDAILLSCIRRATLDAMWSREPSTVGANLREWHRGQTLGREILGIESVMPALGPFPLKDNVGMGIAATMLWRSLDRGVRAETIQFGTMRRLRSAYSNAFNSSPEMSGMAVMAHETRRIYQTECPTYGSWFDRFMLGVHKRMGDQSRPQQAVSEDIVRGLLDAMEQEWGDTDETDEKLRWSLATFAVILLAGYLLGLRGEEIMLVDLTVMLRYMEEGRNHPTHPHVTVPLRGRVESETGERTHHMVLARVTTSGFEPGQWFDRVEVLARGTNRQEQGYLFVDSRGYRQRISDHEAEFGDRLSELRAGDGARRIRLFDPGLTEVGDAYGLGRSLRRGSTTAARVRKVRDAVVELNNRWRKVEQGRGRQAGLRMIDHYTDVKLALPALWEYSHAL